MCTHASLDLLWMGYFCWTSPLSQCHYGFVKYHPHPREHQASPSLSYFLEIEATHILANKKSHPTQSSLQEWEWKELVQDDSLKW